ncbi:MAG: hypothetical protein GFH27_549301n153 [Chloroflexi bacterium AL-W]|nr:hypothetical protein [Chloroflexi bacterium AL-N1]NOK68346.1 hypothetical protein [Chloroflexi bacterium AL-N10]NOK73992.1 hypothetical protein [Chloroflexi bacterium AL-N5]NOK82960.1 hypothetical protein [Chloroflexi bacterium AL-W]NOK90482.1 hypothetical protein [Chloroflexi bacterium AL-N15]
MRRLASWLVLRPPVRTKLEVLVLLILGLLVVIIMLVMHLAAPNTTTAKISQGVQKMIIRLPPTPTRLQEDVLVTGAGGVQEREVIRGPIDIIGDDGIILPYHYRQLTAAEWAQMEAQREAWCADFPVFDPIPEGEPYYDVALRCGKPSDFDTERFLVPLDALPEAFVMLIEALPSPQEAP